MGTFGKRFLVNRSASYVALKPVPDLPGHTEQEIIVANLSGQTPAEGTKESFAHPSPGVTTVWAPAKYGLIDERPMAMLHAQGSMNRIYRHGGVFVIFAAAPFDPKYMVGERHDYSGDLDSLRARPYLADNWCLLPALRRLAVHKDTGQEMDVADNGVARRLGIDGYFDDGHFECVVKPGRGYEENWSTLATNKYGDPVAGLFTEEQEGNLNLIFIFPQLSRRRELVVELVERILPEMSPRLFPHAEGSRWTRRPEYDLPRIASLKSEITAIQEDSRTRVRQLEEKIENERQRYGFLHDLVTATGDDLVQAVIHALQTIGFHDVRDVDAEAEAAGETGPRREDLRIMDAPMPVLVEVKGITGKPKEVNALQVAKYIAPRMKEWGRTDIHGLAIVNHQRNLPALDREHEHVFQSDVLTTAKEQDLTLLTTWDLFRLVRGFISNDWRHEDVAELFVTSGRMCPLPAHYKPIGYVDGYWAKASALGLRLQSGPLHVGDRIAYELPVDFVEESVTSLRINDRQVNAANAGDRVGIMTKLNQHEARKGVRVYRVELDPPTHAASRKGSTA
ncbi:hypothetical protein BJY14_005063 [Actinomadura luteofluorescens]|uniref:Uncharacterized protein n=1 Tax=Actinomadura luteofluorescens TaxID=46163 RepID=A0A7Y9EJS0_9ACTN|nr:hypothetical protein [Actinomadura luteofluorescens]NYD49080.1 hypothetical protein [Actinomadura luteofluorescens]